MRDSKLLKLLSTLNAWDLRHLSDYVHSPFFNKHQRLTQLMDYLIDLAPEFPAEALERKFVYAQIFQEEPWEEQKYKDLLSLAVKLLRSFFAQMRLRENNFAVNTAMLEEFLERGWESEFQKAREALEDSIGGRAKTMQDLYHKRLQLQEIWVSRQTTLGNRKIDDSIQVASDQFDAYYMLSKLRYAVEMVNRKNVVSQEFRTGLLPAVLNFIHEHPQLVEGHPAIRLYLQIYFCLTEPDKTENFERLRLIMRTEMAHFPVPEKREIQAYAINFCIRHVNQGRKEFLSTLLELYQDALHEGILLTEGWLSQWDYKNIVSAGLKAGNFEWSEQFIEEYKAKVEPDSRENAYTYNLASLYFEQGDYKRALRLLQHVEFSDVFYHLGAKVMLLKSFFELNDYEALMSLCDSFKIYLKRNKTLSKAHYTVNFNLIGFTRKLAELRRKVELVPAPESRGKLQELREKITATGAVAQLPWLLGKLDVVAERVR